MEQEYIAHKAELGDTHSFSDEPTYIYLSGKRYKLEPAGEAFSILRQQIDVDHKRLIALRDMHVLKAMVPIEGLYAWKTSDYRATLHLKTHVMCDTDPFVKTTIDLRKEALLVAQKIKDLLAKSIESGATESEVIKLGELDNKINVIVMGASPEWRIVANAKKKIEENNLWWTPTIVLKNNKGKIAFIDYRAQEA